MSKLEELIAELCPDGVEYKPLEKLCTIITKQTGFDYSNYIKPRLLLKEESNSVPYIQTKFFNGKIFDFNTDYYVPQDIVEKFPKITLDEKCLLFSIVGASIGNVGCFLGTRKSFLGGAICVAKIKPEYNIDYLYYCAESKCIQDQIKKKIKGAGQATVTIADIRQFLFPLPPLPIQQEIVRILDSFTEYKAELETELETELEARKKQYEYYRDSLLSFEGDDSVKWMKLGEIAAIYDGTHQTPKYTETGIPFISVENISDIYNSTKYIDKHVYEKNYRIKPQKNDIFMTRIGSIGFCAVMDRQFDLAYYVSLALIRVNTDIIMPKYLKYLIESSIGKKELAKRTLVNAVPIKINKGDIGKINLPIPPLSKQQRIVDILNRFDALCNDITTGLPAEIAARQKQYEYYRDKLLTFKEKQA